MAPEKGILGLRLLTLELLKLPMAASHVEALHDDLRKFNFGQKFIKALSTKRERSNNVYMY